MTFLRKYAKFVTALLGAVGVAISEGLVPGATAHWLSVAVAFLATLGVYSVPNTPPAAVVPVAPVQAQAPPLAG